MEKFNIINEKCIGCKACERVAESNFTVEDKLAKVFKQPDNEEELTRILKSNLREYIKI